VLINVIITRGNIISYHKKKTYLFLSWLISSSDAFWNILCFISVTLLVFHLLMLSGIFYVKIAKFNTELHFKLEPIIALIILKHCKW
jgi:hypothetical protein